MRLVATILRLPPGFHLKTRRELLRMSDFNRKHYAAVVLAACFKNNYNARGECSACVTDPLRLPTYRNAIPAHHEDYTKPLEVVFLCRKHHARRHIELGTTFNVGKWKSPFFTKQP